MFWSGFEKWLKHQMIWCNNICSQNLSILDNFLCTTNNWVSSFCVEWFFTTISHLLLSRDQFLYFWCSDCHDMSILALYPTFQLPRFRLCHQSVEFGVTDLSEITRWVNFRIEVSTTCSGRHYYQKLTVLILH